MMDSADNAALALALSDTAGAVEALWKDHGTVLVHCVGAESRTPTVVARATS